MSKQKPKTKPKTNTIECICYLCSHIYTQEKNHPTKCPQCGCTASYPLELYSKLIKKKK